MMTRYLILHTPQLGIHPCTRCRPPIWVPHEGHGPRTAKADLTLSDLAPPGPLAPRPRTNVAPRRTRFRQQRARGNTTPRRHAIDAKSALSLSSRRISNARLYPRPPLCKTLPGPDHTDRTLEHTALSQGVRARTRQVLMWF
mgnify:CR=1 FL=1